MQAQTARRRWRGNNWLIGSGLAFAVAIAGSGIAATQVADIDLPWTSSDASTVEVTRPYIRPTDRPAIGSNSETTSDPPTFNRPTDKRNSEGAENWVVEEISPGRPADRP